MDYPTPLVSAEWLYGHLEDPLVRVIDCRFALMEPDLGIRQYQTGHIPGAVHLDLNRDLASVVQRHGGRHPLPDINKLAKTLGRAGIQSGHSSIEIDNTGQTNYEDSHSSISQSSTHQPTFVVIYDDSRFAFASRLWWLLRYLGHPQVAILDGGFHNWETGGYPVSQDQFVGQAKEFIPNVQPGWVVDIQNVKKTKDLASTILVDSRQGDRYRGEREPIDPIAGHIPGAVNLFWKEVTTEDGYAQPIEQQQQRWQAVLGALSQSQSEIAIATPKDVVVYCGSGVTACVNLLSLELAQLPPGKLYAGSWSDWCSYM
ncbi:MAG: sulfurtransferase [Cyanobacteria bacterium P01_F01_bin.150]